MTESDAPGLISFEIDIYSGAISDEGLFGQTTNSTSIIFDRTVPSVSAIEPVLSHSKYILGDSIDFKVEFSEPVYLNPSDQSYPYIILNIGDSISGATYIDGSGTQNLIFRYFVGDGDYSQELEYTSESAFVIAEGQITDNAGNPAAGLLPPAGSEGSLGFLQYFLVDGERPFVKSSTFYSDHLNSNYASLGTGVNLSFITSEPVSTPLVFINGQSVLITGSAIPCGQLQKL